MEKSDLDGAELLDKEIEKGAVAKKKTCEMALWNHIFERETTFEAPAEVERHYPGPYTPFVCVVCDDEYATTDTMQKCRDVVASELGSVGQLPHFRIDRNKLLFLLCGGGEGTDIEDVLKKYQATLLEEGIVTSYIVGSPQNHLNEVSNSYHAMRKAMFTLVCYDSGNVIFCDVDEDDVEFPSNAVTMLTGLINTGDKKKIISFLNQLFLGLKEKKSSLISIYLLQITLGVISHIASFAGSQSAFDYRDMIDRMTEASSSSYAQKLLSQFCFEACDYIASVQDATKKTLSVETRIMEYLNENYSNANLSLTLIADKFGYSSKYLGRLFMNHADMPITQYLTDLRMEKARELILRTNLPIAEIVESVGITTIQHFYRLFKKRFGYSPAAMRKKFNV
jgi:YesN/AraC family two-component response regulator